MKKIYAFCLWGLTHILCLVGMDQPPSPSRQICNPFNKLAPDALKLVFSFYNNSNEKIAITETLKMVRSLNRTCKSFHKLLDFETIGILFKKHTDESKKNLLKTIIFNSEKTSVFEPSAMKDIFYAAKRQIIGGLFCAGAELRDDDTIVLINPNRWDERDASDKLIYSAMVYNDIALINFLYSKNKINLYQQDLWGTPLCFYARTPQMIEACEKNGVDVQKAQSSNDLFPNVLWFAVIANNISADMVEYYLTKNIPIESRSSDGYSLLHGLAESPNPATNTYNLIKKAELLLKKQPHLIKAVDKTQKTPLDCAKRNLERGFTLSDDNISATTLIAFLEKENDKHRKKSTQETKCCMLL